MTNQASELFELCKEVYEKTGWDKADKFWHSLVSHDMKRWSDYKLQDYKPNDLYGVRIVPLYTSDYLLEKLPQSIDAGRSFAVDMFLVLDRPKSLKYRYRAFYTAPSYGKRHEVVADTPLKALLKLTIALSEAGELE